MFLDVIGEFLKFLWTKLWEQKAGWVVGVARHGVHLRVGMLAILGRGARLYNNDSLQKVILQGVPRRPTNLSI